MYYNLLLTFCLFSFFGAVCEHLTYYFFPSAVPKALSNPIIEGFPIYGSGGLLAIWMHKYIKKLPLFIQFLLYGFTFSTFEFIVGLWVGAGKKSYVDAGNNNKLISAWDYSNNFGNILGIIDIYHFVVFGILGMIAGYGGTYLYHKLKPCIK